MTNKNWLAKLKSNAASWRYRLVQVGLLSAALMIGYQIVDLQLLDRQFLQSEGDKRSVRYESIPAHRGVIFDRNNKPLAVSTPVVTIWAMPGILYDSRSSLPELAQALDISLSWLEKRVETTRNREFIYLKRQMTPEEAEKVMALKVPGVYSRKEQRRYYPAGEVAAHVVGFTNIDERGQEGIELAYNRWLTGSHGRERVMKDRKGQVIREAELIESSRPGNELMLSIDMRLQYMAYRELKKAVETYRAEAGSLVMLDVKTGEILAMVNQPSYNPNNRAGMQAYRMRNRTITDAMEPGSVLKPFIVAAALESGKFTRDSIIHTGNGYMRLGRYDIRDTGGYGSLDLTGVLQKSSNVGMTKMALEIGSDSVTDMLQRVGFGQSTGIGFPGENTGNLPYRNRWSDIEIATLSYGYGMTASPLQIAQAYMTLGSGGIMRPVSMIRRDVPPEGVRVMDEEVARELLDMLEAVVGPGGTARRAGVASYRVGGKTGTARKVGQSGYDKNRYTGVFAGLAPINDPRLAIVIVIDEPGGDAYYGGLTAAPVFSKVAAGALRMLAIEPESGQKPVAATGPVFLLPAAGSYN